MASARTRSLFTSVLCPVDFSDHSRLALQYGLAMAHRSGADATALFVNDTLLVAATAAAFGPTGLQKQSLAELRTFVDAVRQSLGADAPDVACQVGTGDPPDEIKKAARRLRADLVVVGTQGLSGARKAFFGSTTARILKETRTPVLAVPPGAVAGGRNTWPSGTLLAAVDIGKHTEADIRAFANAAKGLDLNLLVVHAMKPLQAPGWLSARAVSHDRDRVTEASSRLEAIAKKVGAGRKVRSQVVVGEPGDVVPTVARDAKCDLIAVVLRDDGGWLGARRGSITYDVLRQAATPVLALPGKSRRGAAVQRSSRSSVII